MPTGHQGRACGDALGGGDGLRRHQIIGHNAVHQVFPQGFPGAEDAAFQGDFHRRRAANDAGHGLHFVERDHQAQILDRHAKAAALAANAHVAATGQFQPAADAGAVDHRHHWVAAVLDRIQGGGHYGAVGPGAVPVETFTFELGDVGPGGKGLFTTPP